MWAVPLRSEPNPVARGVPSGLLVEAYSSLEVVCELVHGAPPLAGAGPGLGGHRGAVPHEACVLRLGTIGVRQGHIVVRHADERNSRVPPHLRGSIPCQSRQNSLPSGSVSTMKPALI